MHKCRLIDVDSAIMSYGYKYGAGPKMIPRALLAPRTGSAALRRSLNTTSLCPGVGNVASSSKSKSHPRKRSALCACAQNGDHDPSPRTVQRRAVLQAVPAFLCASEFANPAASSPTQEATLSPSLQKFWNDCLSAMKSGVGECIDVNLIVWSPKTRLPFGSPGDPASDYTTGGLLAAFSGGCGVRQKSSSQPYQGCPAPGLPASTDLLSECCRHYAYCVPYTPRSTEPLSSTTTIVVSERINDAPDNVGKGILAHELGHSIDFHCFGTRYRLRDHAPDGAWADALAALNVQDSNFEIRADSFAGLILAALKAGQLCYATDTRTQTVVAEDERCAGTATRQSMVDGPFAKHYLHSAPVSGILSF